MYVESFKKLIVWQRGVELAKEVYKITDKFPKMEIYGLANQMKRAAISIPSNIAEGRKRGTKKDFLQFLRVADGSAAELETQMIIAKDLYPNVDFLLSGSMLEEVQKMLAVMIKNLGHSKS